MSLDRYAGDPLNGPQQFAEELREIKRRLSGLEGARPLGNTTVARGRTRFTNEDRVDAITIGLIDEAGDDYGIEFVADGGNPIYRFTTDRGQVFPGVPVPMVVTSLFAGSGFAVTSGSFVDVFARSVDTAIADALHVVIPWTTGSATTGEIRLHNNIVGGASSDPVTLDAASGGYAEFTWLHGQEIGSGPFEPVIQVRRTAGAGDVTVFWPGLVNLLDGERIGATTGGVSA